MEVNPAATTSGKSAGQSQTQLAKDFDQFLTLLTTQLQHQDPLDPMDSGEFTDQLVSFSQVEQSIATNKNLETLISQAKNAEMTAAVGYLGNEVTVETDRAGLKDGAARWEYGLASNSETTTLKVIDSNGKTIYEGAGNNKAGLHEFDWDAPANTPDGIYQLTITAKTADGADVQTAVYSKGKVESIESLDGEIHLAVNGILTPVTNIQAVKSAKPDAEDAS